MAHHPFAENSASAKSYAHRRRSTRVNVAVPIILSGRDASGRAFRDETYTAIVSLHGALVQTSRQLLVGMQVTIESPRAGITEKAICVHVDEPAAGEAVHTVGVQLVRPGNIWGLENPPADWQVAPATPRQSQPAAAAPPVSKVAGPARLSAEQLLTLEQQATQITDAAVVRLRGLVEEMLATAFDDFQRRLESALAGEQERLGSHSTMLEQQAGAAVEGAVERLRQRVEEKLAAATEDFQHRLDSKLAAAEERIDKRSTALEQQAAATVEGAMERLRAPVEEKLAAGTKDFQHRLDSKLAATEERIDKRSAALEQQASTTIEGAVERLRQPVEEKLAAATEDFQHRLDSKLTAAEERIATRIGALERQAVTAVDGTVGRLQVSVAELLASAFEDFQPQLDAKLAAAEEQIDNRFAALEAQVAAAAEGAMDRLQGPLEEKLASSLEQQAATTVEGALERLRQPVEEKLAAASEDFQRRLEAGLAAAEERITRRSDESFAQLEDALKTFRQDLEDELHARTEETVASTEQELRARMPSLIASIFAPPGTVPPSPKPKSK